MTKVQQNVAHPWQCDVMGHLTTRFYVGMFDNAAYHFVYELFGWSGSQDAKKRLAWVDVRHVINYQAEVVAGDLLEISASLVKLGTKSLTAAYEMRNLSKNEIAATLESTSVLFDLKKRKAVVISETLREQAKQHLVKNPGAC